MSERLKILQSMLENDPNDSFLHYALAKEMESLGEYENALQHFTFIKTHDPGYVGMYYHLGKLYEKMHHFDLALLSYSEGISIAKKIPDFHALSELNTAKLNLEMEL